MTIDLSSFDEGMTNAVRHFWTARENAARKQKERGVSDQGTRGSATAGKNLDGFENFAADFAASNGAPREVLLRQRSAKTMPGFFRPTKAWDLVVLNPKNLELLGAIEFKSQVGSIGNNANNRAEEAVGNAVDLLTAHREGAFGNIAKPFMGYLFVLEESEETLRPRKNQNSTKHFGVFPEFKNASYSQRYEILCRKLVQEHLYDAAGLILTKSDAAYTGEWRSLSELSNPKTLFRLFASRIAAELAEG